ncbi:MAG: hypothetical protein ABS85_08165 [Sphingobacteriales bacterium SCN 48-20]|jgi:hypothetical protein|uniref:DUF6526 family protein n=1 Tax=Terrimonas ferruginea TaxID=249 RepID=UPI00086C0858|nr:DUF6526 family protein [Terrimonas ferruginea]MBN8782835.1 hypothetical protein [Terrimonas ferruginea]ODT92799.1 MAG: hypothetical protein ABS85_08165 [Sphingobacteriales bacterium SCN 48-20]OJW44033.1 MAG: hypothetical protein BGO56_19230 [Sphingobacteriales bacterium 48-107]
MRQQNYTNHVRYYAPHHFVFYPLSLFMLCISIYEYWHSGGAKTMWLIVAAGTGMLIFLSLMLRQHYALMLQDRLVRMELRWRYHVLTGKRLETLENQLRFKQLAALRFASDTELPALADRAVAEKLSPDQIKKSIREWQPDDMRV